MFQDYKIDTGKLNWFLLAGVSIEMDEIENLINYAERAQLYLRAQNQFEIVGYTNRRKFIAVIFEITNQVIVVNEVALPTYETIQDVILRRLAEEAD